MAHLIAPPASVQPMTKEDIAVVQAEKRVDAATREQLVRVYGDSRDPHGRPVDLTRPPHRNWKCSVCGNVSTDIRHLCGTCLSPEPSYVNAKPYGGKQAAADAGKMKSKEAQGSSVLRAGTSTDTGVRLIHIDATKRTYRTFCEPHVPVATTKTAAGRRTATAEDGDEMGVKEGDEDAVWDDEPDCGEGGQSCRPGGGGGGGGSDDGDGEVGVVGGNTPAERRAPHEESVDGGFTHFISIPLGKQPAITANATRVLEDLRSFVGGRAPADDSDAATPDLVTTTPKLHMTLLLLTLPRREDIEFAKELLQGPFAAAWAAVKEKAVAAAAAGKNAPAAAAASPSLALSGDASLAPAHRHPLIRLGGGLQVMPGGADNEMHQPQKAGVVYMGIDDSLALATVQQLQRVLHDSFAELIHDLDEAARSRRILHVTIMNKKWRMVRGARRPFDARPIVDAFQDVSIGAGDDGRQLFEVAELELCSMRRHDAETGTYFAEATVKV